MELEQIYKLGREVFEDDIHLGVKFNEAVHDGDYNRARVITEAMREIDPNSSEILELDTFITNLCEREVNDA